MIARCATAVTLLAWLFLFGMAVAQDRPRIYLGASSKTLGYSPLWVGVKRGFFEQQGLDVQLILLRGVPMTLQALAAGSLQIGSGGPEPYIEASERGLDFAIAGGIINGMAQVIIAGKNYKTIEELRGATFGASSLTSATVTALKEALRQKGLEYPRDYKILIVAGGSAANLTAMQSGQINATTVAVPLNHAAEELGFTTLGRVLDAVPNFQSATIVVRRSWAEKNRALMVRFMKGMVQSLRWLHDNRDAAVEFLAKEMQLKPAHALKGWEYYTQYRLWQVDGAPNIEGMKHNLRVYAEQSGSKGAPPDVRKYIDLSYLNEALKELPPR
jgi:ABC-type nitrate/sulfonate/bicarbonate transport system substrate-binding protein